MHHDVQARMSARAQLCGRLATLSDRAERLAPSALAGEVEALRRDAVRAGLAAADRVARAFTGRLAEARCRHAYPHWFAALADALGCESADPDRAAEAMLAQVMIRHG